MNAGLKAAAGVVSVSMAIVATQAMATVAKDSNGVINFGDAEVDPALQAKMDAAVAKRDVRQAVSEAFSLLASKFGENNVSLSAKYFPGAEGQLAQTARSDDFTQGVGTCYSNCHSACYANCHSACHSACHGSRSWR